MTDIWRSFVAQRILQENDWAVLFHAPTVSQERNEHDLMRDFADEVPGYRTTFSDLDREQDPTQSLQALRELIRWFQDRAVQLH